LYEKGFVVVTANDKKILEFYRRLKKKISSKSEKLEKVLEETSPTIKYENGRM
jgi:hypothetical protein